MNECIHRTHAWPTTNTSNDQHTDTRHTQPKDIEALAARIGKDVGVVTKQIQALEEVNPMLVRRSINNSRHH